MHHEYIRTVEKASFHIFNNHIKDEDRVCLIKTGLKNFTDTVFSLVERKTNFKQLENQLITLRMKTTERQSLS
jgi:hypothetical protein